LLGASSSRRAGKSHLRVEKALRGSGEQFVRERFPTELDAIRRGHVDRAVVIIIDGDKLGPGGRITQIDDACRSAGVEPRRPGDRAAIIVPTWQIETWFAYLDGDTVDEGKRHYPRLARERDCARHVDALVKMCDAGELRAPAPPSLEDGCVEFKSRLM
jgi:hypothetical protein